MKYVISDFRRLRPFRDYIVSQAYGERAASFSGHLLGGLWFILAPVLEMMVYFLLVSIIFNRGSYGEYPIFVGIMTGLIHYFTFQRIISQSVSSIVDRRNIMLQVRIEPLTFVAIACLKVLLDARYYVPLYLAVIVFYGVHPGGNVVWYPLVLALMLITSWALALILAVVYVYFRDMKELSTVVLRMMRYLCPVIYPVAFIPEQYIDLYFLNPFAILFGMIQACLLEARFPPAPYIAGYLAFTVALLLFAHWLYCRNLGKFTKVM